MKKMIKLVLLCICILSLTGCGKKWTAEEIYEGAETRAIKSYNLSTDTNNETENFTLGINKNSKLIHVYIKGREGYKLQTINSNKVEFIETDEIEPCIKGYFNSDGSIYRNSFEIKEYRPFDGGPASLFLTYRIYVPSGYSLVNVEGNSFDINNFIGSLEG